MSYIQVRNWSSFHIAKWINLCLKSIHIHTEDGHKFFEFPKTARNHFNLFNCRIKLS